MNLRRLIPRGVRGAVIVSTLGYFVDVYDLLIFSIVRVKSLKDIGIAEENLLTQGLFILNAQMLGMLLGGILWGVLGDKKGRLTVLMGSIFVYSSANIANAYVHSVEWYALWRFIAGVGLAGELGAGITLVSELMPKQSRGFATTIIASVGVMGAVFAAIVGDYVSWRTAYIIGGIFGLCLLLLRVAVKESHMFHSVKAKGEVRRGDLAHLFLNWNRFSRYMNCVLVGMPIWYVIGILVTFSPEFGKTFGIQESISAGKSVMYAYIGLVLGDLTSGLLSQFLKTRKKVIFLFIILTLLSVLAYLFGQPSTVEGLYWACFPLGFSVGYWALFVTNAAEQFGTNLRSTVATTVPNFVRGAVVPITLCFEWLKPGLGIRNSALIVGAACILISLIALRFLGDYFGKDLDYVD